jgi:hypothetical protein
MFGRGLVISKTPAPIWIMDIISDVEKKYDIYIRSVNYIEAKRKSCYGGMYYHSKECVEFYFYPEKTDTAITVVLHELAHAIQYQNQYDSCGKREKGKRNIIHHNEKFYSIVYKLYKEYDLINTVLLHSNEYKKCKKYIIEREKDGKI